MIKLYDRRGHSVLPCQQKFCFVWFPIACRFAAVFTVTAEKTSASPQKKPPRRSVFLAGNESNKLKTAPQRQVNGNNKKWNILEEIMKATLSSALQIGQDSYIYTNDIMLGWVYDIISHLICILYAFFKLEYLRN